MMQLNLLPDVKLEYIKARRTRRLVTVISVTVTVVAVLIMGALLANVKGLQAKHLKDLNKDIASMKSQLESNASLNQVLTIQNQLNSLPALDDQKPVVSRLLGYDKDHPGYLTQITPEKVAIGTLDVDFAADTISLQGTADALSTVNKYADTLKFTKYITSGDTQNEQNAFTNVVLSGFGYQKDGVYYTLTFSYNPDLFDIKKTITLDVPKGLITTRSALDRPEILFNGQTGPAQNKMDQSNQ